MSEYAGNVPQWLENNKIYAQETFPTEPAPFHLAVARPFIAAEGKLTATLTCMDPRCVPDKYFGPVYGGASFRNAGGRATDDVIASIMSLRAIARLSTVAVVHHTDCGLLHITKEQVVSDAAELGGPEGKASAEKTDFKLFTQDTFDEAIREDVRTLRAAPMLAGLQVYGFKLDTFTGKITPIEV